MRKWIIAVVVIAAAGTALGFTDPGHRVLDMLGARDGELWRDLQLTR